MDGLGDGDGMGFGIQPIPMSQQSQVFGNYAPDASQMGMHAGSMYADDAALAAGEDTNDAKRRRIARVGILSHTVEFDMGADSWFWGTRLATCAGRRRSNAMARCPNVRIVSTTRRIAFLHRLRRSGIRRRGTWTFFLQVTGRGLV